MQTIQDEIEAKVQEAVERMRRAVIYNLKDIGEKCVNAARITEQKGRDYTDQSENLRSSTGYVLVVDGEIVAESSFQAVGGGTEGAQGGRTYAENLASRYPTGIALIVVAGMHYAEYVAAKGYDVLDTSERLAQQLVNKLMNDIESTFQ